VFEHVTVAASDLEASRRFYGTVLAAIGVGADPSAWRDFRLVGAAEDASATRHLHIAFVTRSSSEVDTFWRAGVDAGYRSDGEPGPRSTYSADYYGGFLLDPDGNSAEGVYLGRPRAPGGIVDHLWIRVADLSATRSFWDEVAPTLGLTIYGERPERFHVGASDRSFALVADGRPVTSNLELGFPGPGDVARAQTDPDGNRIVVVTASSS
jgi:catechol 2,3-dioxygenase-like lactoylglutathione lyase family enzyme